MALKITTQIGTDKGITSEAYVRISDYQLSKNGSANFKIELFQNENDSVLDNLYPINYNIARNQQIGDNLFIELTSEIEQEISIPSGFNNAEGEVSSNSIQTITRKIADLSTAQGVDIFTFGYLHLKAKLIDLFGEANVVDC